ncbi:MAG: type I 3-dehydroquinate dehydratase [Actinomycetaceae bacterium]|nr:type I 3-dehydroquinate dehydratase [Actinomycetaceae bacterium]
MVQSLIEKASGGKPQVIVPIVGAGRHDILAQARTARQSAADIVEWRIDFFDDWRDTDACCALAGDIAETIGKPLLGTFRTRAEGGRNDIAPESYSELLGALAGSGAFWALDVEAFFTGLSVGELISTIHDKGCAVIASNHDFNETPPVTEICARLSFMEKLGADVAKCAYMPQDMTDVARLLEATASASQNLEIPIITMSMGETGVISRIAGSLFGSAATFASLETASAPGQIPLEDMTEILSLLQKIN